MVSSPTLVYDFVFNRLAAGKNVEVSNQAGEILHTGLVGTEVDKTGAVRLSVLLPVGNYVAHILVPNIITGLGVVHPDE